MTGVEEQRGKIGCFAEAFNPADKNGVVTGKVLRLVGDFEGRAAIRENRGAARSCLPRQADKAISRPGGEAIRQILLVDRENIDGVVAGAAEGFEVV